MRTSRLLFGLLLSLLVWSSACATQSGAASCPCNEQDVPDCAAAGNQKVLTYCVSPGAASFAARSQRVRRSLASGAQLPPSEFPLPIGDSPVRGPEDAAVTIVMFSDLECPFCATAHANLETLRTLRPDDVRIVYKHYPLTGIHPNALEAAHAARAAQAQGKFWEFVDALYQRQGELGPELYGELVSAAGGDARTLEQSRASGAVAQDVARDRSLGEAIGVRGTPTIFLNGVRIPPDVGPEALADVVDQQRAAADAFVSVGVPRSEIYPRLVLAQYQPVDPAEEEENPEANEGSVVFIPTAGAPQKGAKTEDALATLVIFSDFECPFCASLNPSIDAVLAANPELRVVYRHFPLPIHDRADNAAGLAVLAQQKGVFWRMHDLLFANQDKLKDADLQRYADELGMGIADVNAAMREAAIFEVINADMTIGLEAGVIATPSFFINGKMYVGVYSPEELDQIVREQVDLGRRLQSQTSKTGDELYEECVAAQLADGE